MSTVLKHLALFGVALGAVSAQAHEGHGLGGGAHWHATDTFGLALVVAVAVLAWATRRD